MNPILLKPEADHRSQLVVLGRPAGNLASKDYASRQTRLWGTVTSALDTLSSQYDVVVIEGAGSPDEINLIEGDVTESRGLLDNAMGCRFEAYEIHIGQTIPTGTGTFPVSPAISVRIKSGIDPDGVIGYLSGDGWIFGTYTHGMLGNTQLRRTILGNVTRSKCGTLGLGEDSFSQTHDYNKLADHVRASIDMSSILESMGLKSNNDR